MEILLHIKKYLQVHKWLTAFLLFGLPLIPAIFVMKLMPDSPLFLDSTSGDIIYKREFIFGVAYTITFLVLASFLISQKGEQLKHGNTVNLYEGIIYKDDRIFILDLTPAEKNNESVWAVVTRRNCDGAPIYRIDDFPTKEEAIKFIKKIEPTTPFVSLGGRQPASPLSYKNYCRQLTRAGLLSAMEIYALNENLKRNIVIEELSKEDLNEC